MQAGSMAERSAVVSVCRQLCRLGGASSTLICFPRALGLLLAAMMLMSVPLAGAVATPMVLALSPTQGPAGGGTSVTIIGSGFTGVTAVIFGGTQAPGFVVDSDTQISAVTPAHAVGTVDVRVETAADTGTLSNGYTYIVATAPAAPTGVSATAGDREATVSFTTPAYDGGAAITSYTVTSSPGGQVASGPAGPLTVTGLTNGTSYIFTVTATNAAGTSDVSGASNAVIPTAPPAPVANNVFAYVAANSSSNPITLNVVGGAPVSGAVVILPSHGTVNVSGLSFLYTPTPGYSGSDSFTYTVTNGGGTSAPATVSITVTAPVLTFSPTAGALPAATFAVAYSQTITASGGTAPYTYAITSGSLPSGLSLNTSTGVVSGTPTTAGNVSFTVTATDAWGVARSVSYSLAVTGLVTPTISLSASSASVIAGDAITFTATVSGGASPTGTVAFREGGTTLGSASLAAHTATFSTSSLAVGTHSVTAVYAGDTNNAAATSSGVTVAVGSGARPDPSQDATTEAIVTSQVTTSARFGQAQINNTVQRLERLHDQPAASTGSGQTASSQSASYPSPALVYGNSDNAGTAQLAGQLSQALEAVERKAGLPFHLWSSGSVDWGRTTADADDHFTTSGFTVGLDRQMTDMLTMGLSGGFGIDHSTFGSAGGSSDGTAYTAQLYATVKLAPKTYVDLLGGYGALHFDSERWSNGSRLDGARDGHDLFGSLGLSTARDVSGVRLTGYGRVDVVKATLDGYAESGPAALALAYDELDTTTVAGVAGVRAAYALPMSWGTLTPSGRIEYRHAFDGGFTQNLGYADLGGFGYAISGESSTKDSATFGFGLGATTLDGLDLDLEYSLSTDKDGIGSQQVRAGVRLPF